MFASDFKAVAQGVAPAVTERDPLRVYIVFFATYTAIIDSLSRRKERLPPLADHHSLLHSLMFLAHTISVSLPNLIPAEFHTNTACSCLGLPSFRMVSCHSTLTIYLKTTQEHQYDLKPHHGTLGYLASHPASKAGGRANGHQKQKPNPRIDQTGNYVLLLTFFVRRLIRL